MSISLLEFSTVIHLYLGEEGEVFPIPMSPSSLSFCSIKVNLEETSSRKSSGKKVNGRCSLEPYSCCSEKVKFCFNWRPWQGERQEQHFSGVREITLGMNFSPPQFQILVNVSQASLGLKDFMLDLNSQKTFISC